MLCFEEAVANLELVPVVVFDPATGFAPAVLATALALVVPALGSTDLVLAPADFAIGFALAGFALVLAIVPAPALVDFVPLNWLASRLDCNCCLDFFVFATHHS